MSRECTAERWRAGRAVPWFLCPQRLQTFRSQWGEEGKGNPSIFFSPAHLSHGGQCQRKSQACPQMPPVECAAARTKTLSAESGLATPNLLASLLCLFPSQSLTCRPGCCGKKTDCWSVGWLWYVRYGGTIWGYRLSFFDQGITSARNRFPPTSSRKESTATNKKDQINSRRT